MFRKVCSHVQLQAFGAGDGASVRDRSGGVGVSIGAVRACAEYYGILQSVNFQGGGQDKLFLPRR